MSELIDNRAFRIRTMKEIIRHLHEGDAPEKVRRQMRQLVRETDPSEIAAMEQELIAEGMPAEEVQSMCDLHSATFREILKEQQEPETTPGHPMDTFRRENEALARTVRRMRDVMQEISSLADDASADEQLERWRQSFNDLMDVEKHYQRKENLLFSCLERHGITGPSKVMWGKDDEARDLLRTLGDALRAEGNEAAQWKLVIETVAEAALNAVQEMIFKEEKILLPMSLGTLTEDDWAEIWRESPRFGYCLVEPGDGYTPAAAASPPPPAHLRPEEAIVFPTGSLTEQQVRGLLGVLPVDITFVDDDDRVRYFSEGPDRTFVRSKAILGRKVQHCHPPKSVHIVEQIVNDFRNGRRDVAEFWIDLHGKFVHIRYFAVRDDEGRYLGTLEVTQDLTRLRALQGEKRLLAYGDSQE